MVARATKERQCQQETGIDQTKYSGEMQTNEKENFQTDLARSLTLAGLGTEVKPHNVIALQLTLGG